MGIKCMTMTAVMARGLKRREAMRWTGRESTPDRIGLGIGLVADGYSV